MSIDTTFQPKGSSQAIASGAPAQLNGGQSGQLGITTFRVVNTTAASAATRISWAASAAAATVPAAPGPANMIIPGNGVVYIEVPCNSFFNTSGNVEIIGGQGGVGG